MWVSRLWHRDLVMARLNGKARLVCKRQPYEPSEANTAFPQDERESLGEGGRKIRAKCHVCLAWLIKPCYAG